MYDDRVLTIPAEEIVSIVDETKVSHVIRWTSVLSGAAVLAVTLSRGIQTIYQNGNSQVTFNLR